MSVAKNASNVAIIASPVNWLNSPKVELHPPTYQTRYYGVEKSGMAITINQELLQLIPELVELKGKWELLKTMSHERFRQLRRVATIESIGSST